MKDLYSTCLNEQGAGATDSTILQCISKAVENAFEAQEEPEMGISLVLSGALVFCMQVGFAMVCAGFVRKKNVQNTMLKNLLDASGASVSFFCVGYAIAFGGQDATSPSKSFIGTSNFFLLDVSNLGYWFYQYCFSAASTTIVAGTLAERCQMAAYLCYSMMLSGFVYPIVARALWSYNGILSPSSIDPFWGVGCVDFAGSGVVHITGGTTALFATAILGARRGRFHDDSGRRLDVPREFRGHSVALQVRVFAIAFSA
jgi:ammonium transporter, Amt family